MLFINLLIINYQVKKEALGASCVQRLRESRLPRHPARAQPPDDVAEDGAKTYFQFQRNTHRIFESAGGAEVTGTDETVASQIGGLVVVVVGRSGRHFFDSDHPPIVIEIQLRRGHPSEVAEVGENRRRWRRLRSSQNAGR